MAAFGQILNYIIEGGPEIMVPLVLLFIIGLTYAIERFIALAKAKINTAEFLTKIRASPLPKQKSIRQNSLQRFVPHFATRT